MRGLRSEPVAEVLAFVLDPEAGKGRDVLGDKVLPLKGCDLEGGVGEGNEDALFGVDHQVGSFGHDSQDGSEIFEDFGLTDNGAQVVGVPSGGASLVGADVLGEGMLFGGSWAGVGGGNGSGGGLVVGLQAWAKARRKGFMASVKSGVLRGHPCWTPPRTQNAKDGMPVMTV